MELSKLMRECKQGSITAQKCLFDQLSVQLFLVCRRYMKTDEDAEEMLMNGFMKIFTGAANFVYKNDGGTVAWMKKIMINECLLQLRKKNIFLLSVEKETEDVASAENVLDQLTATEIFNIITQLPVGYRTIFNLYAIEGMTHPEIAAALGISEGTSKSQLSKARKMLQQLLQQNDLGYERRNATR